MLMFEALAQAKGAFCEERTFDTRQEAVAFVEAIAGKRGDGSILVRKGDRAVEFWRYRKESWIAIAV